MADTKTHRPPSGFRTNEQDGTIACPHRDLSCCDDCVAAHPELVDVCGVHMWIADPVFRATQHFTEAILTDGLPLVSVTDLQDLTDANLYINAAVEAVFGTDLVGEDLYEKCNAVADAYEASIGIAA